MQAALDSAERRIQLLEHASQPRGTLAAFADQLRAFIANVLTRLNAVRYTLLWPESFVLTDPSRCILSPCRFDEDDDKRRLTIAVALVAWICAVRILHQHLMARMG